MLPWLSLPGWAVQPPLPDVEAPPEQVVEEVKGGHDVPVTDPPRPGQVTEASPHFDLEVLYEQERFTEGLAIARERYAAEPNDPVLPWMIVRFVFSESESHADTANRAENERLYGDLVAIVEDALAKHPGDPHLLFARGLGKGRLGTSRGVLASLFMADDIENDWLASVNSGYQYASLAGAEVLPCDVMTGLGIFYRLVPDWWIVQALAGTRGDLYASLEWHEKSVACDGGIGALKELGVTATCIGVKNGDQAMIEAGRSYLRQSMKLRPRTAIEHIDIAHDAALLANPNRACEYSRDGQQDLDREKLKDGKTK